ncbi:N-acetylglucosamine kinase [Devosia sp.]|uniref:N-acetylglucosamine kinase n=1 Tax=Devosia sp. TaxID=1871048 RepID=UPI002AFEF07C|nr:BadF/BadG/BcrA/BcrD ATPase family protein [Devosia sp.]
MSVTASGRVLVGIDAGGTKTHIRIETTAGVVLGDRVHGNTGWAAMTDAARAEALAQLLRDELSGMPVPAAIVAGVHGNDSPEQHDTLIAPLRRHYPLVEMLNDSHLLVLAHGLSSGTGLVAGTGSSATAILADGGAVTVGGWGWVLGDEGGAVGLVRDAARQVLDAYDSAEQDCLAPALMQALGVTHPHAWSYHLASVEPRLWAQAARVVFEAAASGSVRARRIILDQAEAMARLIEQLRQRGGDVSTVVCAGGVLRNQPALFDAFSSAVAQRLGDGTTVAMLANPPVSGAINRARQLAGSAFPAKAQGA